MDRQRKGKINNLERGQRYLFIHTVILPYLARFRTTHFLCGVALNKHENAPPVKSGALYQNTVPLPHLKHRLIQCVNSVFRFLCPESLAVQGGCFAYHCSMFYGFKKERV